MTWRLRKGVYICRKLSIQIHTQCLYLMTIFDFGLSRILAVNEQSQETASDAGPIRWLPPEALENRTYSFKTDVFSFACVLYELYDRKTPWHDLSAAQVMLRVGSGQVLPPSKNMPEYIVTIMAACQQFTPEDRPDMQDVVTRLRENMAK
jgi:serine/threonine protein kinase